MAVGGGGFRFSGATGVLSIKTAYDPITGGRRENVVVEGGKAYGNDALLPLIGGSGGGGGASGAIFHGAGGGGGGGAILVAVSGRLELTGSILANGGSGGKIKKVILSERLDANGCGGSGSGGAVRLTATTLNGNGEISVNGGTLPIDYCGSIVGGKQWPQRAIVEDADERRGAVGQQPAGHAVERRRSIVAQRDFDSSGFARFEDAVTIAVD